MEPKKIGCGFGVLILRDNKILLGQRHPDPVKASSALHGEGTWTMPGGKLHFGESFEQGAQREILEEIGIDVPLSDLKVICLNSDIVSDAHFITIGLICTNLVGEARVMEPDEITQWKWFDMDNLPTPLFSASEKVLNNFKEGVFYKS